MAIQYSDAEFILLFRKLINWEWYTDVNTKVLFIHCLLRANWKPGSWKGISYNRGQFITSLNTLAVETGLSVKMVRTALSHLIMTGEVTSEGQGKGKAQYRIITVVNYDSYQLTGQHKASKGQAKGKAGANKGQQYKEDKESKEVKEEREEPALPPVRITRFSTGTYDNVFLSNDEAAKLMKELGETVTRRTIDALSEYMHTHKHKYSDDGHYAVIRKWAKEDGQKYADEEEKEINAKQRSEYSSHWTDHLFE